MQISLNADDIRPIVRTILAEMATENKDDLGYLSEADAAVLLGVKRHVLRDLRRRGLIGYSQIVGRRIRYKRSDLLGYLERCHVSGRGPETPQATECEVA